MFIDRKPDFFVLGTKVWFDKIKDGKKVVEVRHNTNKYGSIKTGDIVLFRGPNDTDKVRTKVTGVRKYATVKLPGTNTYKVANPISKLLSTETVKDVFPGMKKEEAVGELERWGELPEEGLTAIRFRVLEDKPRKPKREHGKKEHGKKEHGKKEHGKSTLDSTGEPKEKKHASVKDDLRKHVAKHKTAIKDLAVKLTDINDVIENEEEAAVTAAGEYFGGGKKKSTKKSTTKKSTTKKSATKKSATKKPSTKKSTTKKSATKKPSIKKSSTSKSVTKLAHNIKVLKRSVNASIDDYFNQ
jgi:ASC-1-like (ASCH) protein